jgi:hypothetical protein
MMPSKKKRQQLLYSLFDFVRYGTGDPLTQQFTVSFVMSMTYQLDIEGILVRRSYATRFSSGHGHQSNRVVTDTFDSITLMGRQTPKGNLSFLRRPHQNPTVGCGIGCQLFRRQIRSIKYSGLQCGSFSELMLP